MNHRLVIYPAAADDLESIQTYISKDSQSAGQRFVDSVFQTMNDLLEYPTANAILELPGLEKRDLRRARIKTFPNHLILYRWTEDAVVVLRVFHAAQNWFREALEPY